MNSKTEPTDATLGGDTSGLILTNLTTRADRNAAEWESITRAYDKYIHRARRKKRGSKWLSDRLIREVHFDMFGTIWQWGGKYRTVNVNIGIEWNLVPEEIGRLCGDFAYWDSNSSTMLTIEVATRLHHRLTKIHPFRNGNGRHARLLTDIFFHSRDHSLPKWPQIHLEDHGNETRNRYIAALQKADRSGEYGELIRFFEDCLRSKES